MFDSFSTRVSAALNKIKKQAKITEENIQPVLQELRVALLEADTSLEVVKSLIDNLRTKALGTEVQKSLNPSQVFISMVHQELTDRLGGEQEILNIKAQPPAVILLVGLQGAGKTSSIAKVALWLKRAKKKKVLLGSLDTTRAAANEQLEVLAKEAEIDFYGGKQRDNVPELAQDLLEQGELGGYDCLLVDTAGRLQTNQELLDELKQICAILKPVETIYTMDSMGGQGAAQSLLSFQEAVDITGIIATKLDSSARCGSILSAKYLTGIPIKMLSNGEKLTDIADFDPSAMAQNIMGGGNLMAAIKQTSMMVDEKDAAKIANKNAFDFETMREQMAQMKKMGGFENIAKKMNLGANLGSGMMEAMMQKNLDQQNRKFIGMIDSMTNQERKNPDILNGSRKIRITKGSGTSMMEMAQLLKRYKMMHKMMKKSKTPKGQEQLMQRLSGLAG